VLDAVTLFVASGITGLGKTVLVVVALTFILWSLYTAMVIPKKRPDYPRRLDVYIVVTALLFAAQLTAVVWVTGTQAVETHTEVSAETEHGDETAGGEETTDNAEIGDAQAGAAVFASAGCGGCHALADAGSSGAVGPDLDELQPSDVQVVAIVTDGRGSMPSFSGQLDEQQIVDVAAYVSLAAGA
jgi:cytochrome c553